MTKNFALSSFVMMNCFAAFEECVRISTSHPSVAQKCNTSLKNLYTNCECIGGLILRFSFHRDHVVGGAECLYYSPAVCR